MTHFPTINAVLDELDSHPNVDGTIKTTAECGRLVARHWENTIYGLAHSTGVELEMTKRKSFLDVTFYLTVSGSSGQLTNFLAQMQGLES